MPLTNNEIKALLDAMKAMAGALERQIPADEPTPPETPSMWGANWQTVW